MSVVSVVLVGNTGKSKLFELSMWSADDVVRGMWYADDVVRSKVQNCRISRGDTEQYAREKKCEQK